MSRTTATEAAVRGWLHPRSPDLAVDMGWRQPFTAAQWRELEQQALIFKYLISGVPVPPDLLLPIQRSFEALPSRFYHHYPALGYFSYYGKKLDPEPGRCRRTDGKKWRCSKDAHPDSKYCERHMHRSRNRSRKHVEAKTNLSKQQSQSHVSSSTATSDVALGSIGSLQNITLKPSMSIVSKPQDLCSGTFGSSNLQLDPQLYGMGCKGYLHGARIEVDEHNFFSKYPGNKQTDLQTNSSLDSSLGLMPSQLPSFATSKAKTSLQYGHYSSQLHEDLNELTNLSLPKQQEQQHSYFRSDLGTSNPGKQECQGLQPSFYEWPKARESWLDIEDEQSEQNSFSATQLSISIPMASSDFSTTTCCSPSDD